MCVCVSVFFVWFGGGEGDSVETEPFVFWLLEKISLILTKSTLDSIFLKFHIQSEGNLRHLFYLRAQHKF